MKNAVIASENALKRGKNKGLLAWSHAPAFSKLRLGRHSKAAVWYDASGTPQAFIFDTWALLDVLSKIDEPLVDRLSDEEYHSPRTNPAGWLIDEIESRIPLSPRRIRSLKSAIQEARRKGWIPFSKIRPAFRPA